MPQGVSGAYKSGYIMGQMSKQGAMNEANEGSLHREGLDSHVMGENRGEFTQSVTSSSGKGSGHVSYTNLTLTTIYSV